MENSNFVGVTRASIRSLVTLEMELGIKNRPRGQVVCLLVVGFAEVYIFTFIRGDCRKIGSL